MTFPPSVRRPQTVKTMAPAVFSGLNSLLLVPVSQSVSRMWPARLESLDQDDSVARSHPLSHRARSGVGKASDPCGRRDITPRVSATAVFCTALRV